MNPEAENNLEDWEAKLADYTFGVMEQGVASEFERQLSECRTHVTLAQEYTQVIGALGYAVAPAEPPSGHKGRLMARLAGISQETASGVSNGATGDFPPAISTLVSAPPPPAIRLLEPYSSPAVGTKGSGERGRLRASLPRIAAIAAMLVVAVGITAYVITQWLPQPQRPLPNYLAFTFQGEGPQPSALASCVINTKTREVEFWATDLQPLTSQQVYELWWLKSNSEPIAAGTFTVDNAGNARYLTKLPDQLSGLQGAAITVEQAPGGPKPVGERVLYGDYRIP